jgi:ATP-binding cassette, subfamily F, member 2
MGKGKRRKGGKGKFTAKKKEEKTKATSLLDEASNNLKKSNVNDASGVLQHVSVTGVLDSRVDSRDIQISSFSIGLHGRRLIEDADLHLNYGRRYGLIGENGSGKSTMLKVIASGELPIPEHIDIYHLDTEAKPSDVTAMEAVMNIVKDKIVHLEKEMEELMEEDPESERIVQICDELDEQDLSTLEARAGELLFGLGFSQAMMHRATKDMSGGWRMRVALAQALLLTPTMLLLDEPTNHLDLGACIWLEDYLSRYKKTLVVVSHSAEFLDSVCTNIMELTYDQKLKVWGGNYSTYVKTKEEVRVNTMKQYKKQEDDIKRLKQFIASCGTYSNLVKQAQSKQKIIDKMVEKGLIKPPPPERVYTFKWPNSGGLPPPVMAFKRVSFSYSGKKEDYLYSDLDFGIDTDSRIALVGPNGAGKSTLLKLMMGDLQPCEGSISRHSHLKIAYYNQHSEDQLDLEKTPLEYIMEVYKDGVIPPFQTTGEKKNPELEEWRGILGAYGINGERQTMKMNTMSDGLKTRVVFCVLALERPHVIMLDEPTNHLDMGGINSLADAINQFDGGMVLVSHDFRLLKQVADEIWVCDNKTIKPWKKDGGINSYKKSLKADGDAALEKYKKDFGGKS